MAFDIQIQLEDKTKAWMVRKNDTVIWQGNPKQFGRFIAGIHSQIENDLSVANGDPNAAITMAVISELTARGEIVTKFVWKNAYRHVKGRKY